MSRSLLLYLGQAHKVALALKHREEECPEHVVACGICEDPMPRKLLEGHRASPAVIAKHERLLAKHHRLMAKQERVVDELRAENGTLKRKVR
jgi:hypothetical protein